MCKSIALLDAKIFGDVMAKQIQINKETLWTGEPHDYSHKDEGKYLDLLRQLLFEGTAKSTRIYF